jgi:hypothetical protein
VAVDVDNDGDLDVAAGALLAGGADVDESTLQALVCLERTDPMSPSTRSKWVISGTRRSTTSTAMVTSTSSAAALSSPR